MKRKLVSLLSVALLLGGSLLSQQRVSGQSPPRKFKHNSKVETKYDKAKDQTTVYLQPMTLRYVKSSVEVRVIGEGRTDFLPAEMLSMTAYFISPGKVLRKPEFVVIGFRSIALDETKFASASALTINLDGSNVSLGVMEVVDRHIDERMSAGSVRYMVEALELPIRYDNFLRITGAQKVKMTLGSTEFELKNEHLEAFRDLISRVP